MSLSSVTKKLPKWLAGSTENMLTSACIGLMVIYIAIAKPQNTPTFFTHPVVKAVVLLFVIYVATQNHLLGLAFGLSMLLTIAYANCCQSNVSVMDGFVDFNTKAIDELMDKLQAIVPHLSVPQSQEEKQEKEQEEKQEQEHFEDAGLDFQPLETSQLAAARFS